MKEIGSEYVVTHLPVISRSMARAGGQMFYFNKVLRVLVFQLNKKTRPPV